MKRCSTECRNSSTIRSGLIKAAYAKTSFDTSLNELYTELEATNTYFLPVLMASGLKEPLLKWANHSSAGAV